jgi:tetratricopeptide (TPR) repeat protein
VLGTAASAAFYRGDFDTSERYAQAAVEEGYPPDDPSPCVATIFLAVILTFAGREDDAAGHLDAAEKAMVGRDDEDYVRTWVQSCRVSLSLFGDDEDEEIAQARSAVSLAERTGNPTELAYASFALAWALRHRHPDEAIAAFDRYVALARSAATTSAVAPALSYAARVAASLGDADGARTRLMEALEESIRDDDWTWLTTGLDVAVDVLWYLGDVRAAAVLAGAVETTLAAMRNPNIASRGPGLAMRTVNLAGIRETLGDNLYEQAHAEGATMSRQDALAFTLQHL